MLLKGGPITTQRIRNSHASTMTSSNGKNISALLAFCECVCWGWRGWGWGLGVGEGGWGWGSTGHKGQWNFNFIINEKWVELIIETPVIWVAISISELRHFIRTPCLWIHLHMPDNSKLECARIRACLLTQTQNKTILVLDDIMTKKRLQALPVLLNAWWPPSMTCDLFY